MADDIDQNYTTVRKWLYRERIPTYMWPVIIQKSARSDAPLTAEQLLALHLGPIDEEVVSKLVAREKNIARATRSSAARAGRGTRAARRA